MLKHAVNWTYAASPKSSGVNDIQGHIGQVQNVESIFFFASNYCVLGTSETRMKSGNLNSNWNL